MEISLMKRSAGNQAVNVNPTNGIDIKITSHGSNWLWTCFCLFACSAIYYSSKLLFKNFCLRRMKDSTAGFSSHSTTKYLNEYKIINALCLWISLVMSYSYFTMASNLGYTGIQTEFNHVTTNDELFGGIRQIFYTKFISWFLCFPSLILILFFFNFGYLLLQSKQIYFITEYILHCSFIEFYVIGLLIGSLIHSDYKWGYWTFSCIMGLLYLLNFNLQKKKYYNYNYEQNDENYKSWCKKHWFLTFINCFHQLVFLLYLVSWSLGDGGNVIQPDSDTVFFGILDLCTFCFIPLSLSFLEVPELFTFLIKSDDLGSDIHDVKNTEANTEFRHSGETEVPEIVDEEHVVVVAENREGEHHDIIV